MSSLLQNSTLETVFLRSQGPPTEVKIGKSGKWQVWGQKSAILGGPSWNHLNGRFGAFNSNPSLNKDLVLREGIKWEKTAHLNGSKRDPPKWHFFDPKLVISLNFPILTSLGGPWDRKSIPPVS